MLDNRSSCDPLNYIRHIVTSDYMVRVRNEREEVTVVESYQFGLVQS
jgi:hypothetical protein